jgi:hypothetical protein
MAARANTTEIRKVTCFGGVSGNIICPLASPGMGNALF